jgi:predicted RNA-binding protein YlxR (DUF448 family)
MGEGMSTEYDNMVLGEIRDALTLPDASIRFVQTFTHGRAVQVYLKTRKIGPVIIVREGQTLTDILTMLGTLMEGDPEKVEAVSETDAECPTCGPTKTEPHPRRPGVRRCVNCKEHLPEAEINRLAKVLYEWQAKVTRENGEASYIASAWREIPDGAQEYWREQAVRIRTALAE